VAPVPDPILIARGLTKRYGLASSPLTVLRDVSFELEPGDTLAVVGPSGSGKTTVLGLCAGLDAPSEGEVVLAGHRLGSMDEDDRARVRNEHVGFIFQNFQLLPTLTALENVMVPLELRGNGAVRDRGVELLQRVGLGQRLDHYPAQLSGGEQQRVALARAFINRPQLLFADEPTGNLDADTAHLVTDMIFELNAAAGTALVLVTHDLELASRCRRRLRLKGGSIVALETR
jgi:putative ABC transport system ATP-binding protein